MLPLHQRARPASLSWLSTTFRVLSRVEYSSYHITVLSSGFEPESPLSYGLCYPLHQLSIYREKGVRSPVCLKVSLVPIYYHTIAVYSLPRETVMQGPRLSGDCYLLEESRWPTQPPVCFISISSTQLILRRMTTLLKVELLLCRFLELELEYRLPPRDFHPPNPSHNLTPRLYFCCMLTTAIVRHTPTLPLPYTQLNQYHLDLLSGLVLSPLCTTSHIVL